MRLHEAFQPIDGWLGVGEVPAVDKAEPVGLVEYWRAFSLGAVVATGKDACVAVQPGLDILILLRHGLLHAEQVGLHFFNKGTNSVNAVCPLVFNRVVRVEDADVERHDAQINCTVRVGPQRANPCSEH